MCESEHGITEVSARGVEGDGRGKGERGRG